MKLTQKSFILLAALPLVYVARSLEAALFAGTVLVICSLVIKGLSIGLKNIGSQRFLIYTYMLTTAALITVAQLLIAAYLTLDQEVGLYLSLLVINGALVVAKKDQETFSKHAIATACSLGLLLIIGLLRELLGAGTISVFFGSMQIIDSQYVLSILVAPSGGFIIAGIIFAVFQKVYPKKEELENVI